MCHNLFAHIQAHTRANLRPYVVAEYNFSAHLTPLLSLYPFSTATRPAKCSIGSFIGGGVAGSSGDQALYPVGPSYIIYPATAYICAPNKVWKPEHSNNASINGRRLLIIWAGNAPTFDSNACQMRTRMREIKHSLLLCFEIFHFLCCSCGATHAFCHFGVGNTRVLNAIYGFNLKGNGISRALLTLWFSTRATHTLSKANGTTVKMKMRKIR